MAHRGYDFRKVTQKLTHGDVLVDRSTAGPEAPATCVLAPVYTVYVTETLSGASVARGFVDGHP